MFVFVISASLSVSAFCLLSVVNCMSHRNTNTHTQPLNNNNNKFFLNSVSCCTAARVTSSFFCLRSPACTSRQQRIRTDRHPRGGDVSGSAVMKMARQRSQTARMHSKLQQIEVHVRGQSHAAVQCVREILGSTCCLIDKREAQAQIRSGHATHSLHAFQYG